jgi:hypothetical protein
VEADFDLTCRARDSAKPGKRARRIVSELAEFTMQIR